MLTSPNRLFAALVVGGTALTLGCAAQADTAPKASSPDLEQDSESEAKSGSEAKAESDSKKENFECGGEGITCSSDGIECCWAKAPGCESCCPDL